MARARKDDAGRQIAVRLDSATVARLEALRAAREVPGLSLTLSDAARMALAVGLDALERGKR